MVKPIDEVTWHQLQVAHKAARRLGRDPFEFLNQVGLLLTPARDRAVRATELRGAAHELENANPEFMVRHFYGGTGMTALDMQRAITAWLRSRADDIEKEE